MRLLIRFFFIVLFVLLTQPVMAFMNNPYNLRMVWPYQVFAGDDETPPPYTYGIHWNQATDTMTTGYVSGGVFIEDNATDLVVQEQLGRGLYVAATDSWTKLDATNSSLLASGGAATLDGSSGDVMVRIPRHYQLWHRDGDDQYILISEGAFTFGGQEAWVPNCFSTYDYYYISAFEGVLDDNGVITTGTGSSGADTTDDALRSLPNYKPWTVEYRSVYRTISRNTGGTAHQLSWDGYQMLIALMVTEWGSWDSQTELPGYTDGDAGWDYAYVRETGRTLHLGDTSGSVQVDFTGEDSDLNSTIIALEEAIANSYRGIENPYGHIWKFLDGINVDNTDGNCTVYTTADYTAWADDTATGYTDTGHAPGFGSDDGYIADIHGSGQHAPFYPSSITGGSWNSHLHDYHWNDSGGWRVLLAGGHCTYGGAAGVASLLAVYGSGLRASYIGARLAARGN